MAISAAASIGDDAGWLLAISCARHAAGIADATEVGDAAARVTDWPAALGIARDQRLDALLARALAQCNAPDRTLSVARDTIATSTARTLGQQRLLARVIGAFDAAGVPALPYKGPVLSMQLYGDPALRSSVDLDVVVPLSAYDVAREVLLSLGMPPRSGHSARQERTLFRWLGQASFGTGREDFVELHWRFAPLQFPFALTPEQALARASRVRLANQEMSAMATDDLAVTLAMHATRHLFERLEWLAGVTRLLLAHASDADALAEHARRLRGRRMLLVAAGVAARVLGAPLGAKWDGVLAADREAQRLAATMSDELRRCWAGGPQLGGAALQRRYAELLDTRADRVRSVVRASLLPTEREWEAIALPDALTPLYHVVRPLRLLAMYARRAMSHSVA